MSHSVAWAGSGPSSSPMGSSPCDVWMTREQYDEERQGLMCNELKGMMQKGLSDNLYEIVSKSL